MTEFNNRDVVRAISKGNVLLLESYFLNGLSSRNVTENEQWNLLHQATLLIGKMANEKSVKLLLSKGINVNAIDAYGNAPIHYAIRNNDVATVKLFVRERANLDISNNEGITPLHQSLLANPVSVELVSYLVESGACINDSVLALSNALGNETVIEILEREA